MHGIQFGDVNLYAARNRPGTREAFYGQLRDVYNGSPLERHALSLTLNACSSLESTSTILRALEQC